MGRRPKALVNALRITSAFFVGIVLGAEGATRILGLPIPDWGYEEEHKKKKEVLAKPEVRKELEITIEKPRKKEEFSIEPGLLPAPSHVVAQHGAYVSAYDQRLRNPAWACVKLEKGNQSSDDNKADRSLSKFKADKAVPDQFRTLPDDFKASGYDRGHLVAATDVTNQKDMDETFLMTNITPQVGAGMNRGFWQMLERFVRKLTLAYDDVFVCSGPLFLPEFNKNSQTWEVRYQVIGPRHDIAVPTHFFKCLHARSGDRQSQTCFVVPNRPIDHNKEPLSKFEAAIEEVEQLAGMKLFPEASANRSVCDEVKCELVREQLVSSGAVKSIAK